MSAIPSIAAISAAASSHRLDVLPQNVASGTASGPLPTAAASTAAPASNTAPVSNQSSVAHAQAAARTNQVDTVNVSLGTVALPDAVTTFDPRSHYGLTNEVPPTTDLASEMIQQLVAFYPFSANGQLHPDTSPTVDIKT
jgi:hypothetical protein